MKPQNEATIKAPKLLTVGQMFFCFYLTEEAEGAFQL